MNCHWFYTKYPYWFPLGYNVIAVISAFSMSIFFSFAWFLSCMFKPWWTHPQEISSCFWEVLYTSKAGLDSILIGLNTTFTFTTDKMAFFFSKQVPDEESIHTKEQIRTWTHRERENNVKQQINYTKNRGEFSNKMRVILFN